MSEAMTVEQALEACPFCGGTPSFASRYHSMFDVKVVCVCDVEGPLFDVNDGRPDELARNRLAAAEHWNARAALSRPAVPEGAEVWVLYDATTDRKYIKKNVGDGCLAVFDYEHEAIDASGRHPGTAYKKMMLVPAPPTQEEQT